jgi:DNA-binding SARP family transcriptional activator
VVLRKDGAWHVLAARYAQQASEQPDLRFSSTIVAKVVENAQPILAVDALNDGRFGNPSSITLQNLRSIVCAPLRWSGLVQGVVYADHNVKAGVFNAAQLDVLSAIADQASRALETAALQEQLQRVHRQSLERMGSTEANAESQAGAQAIQFVVTSLEGGPLEVPWDAADFAPAQGVALSLFGPFRAAVDGRSVETWSTRKNRDLLAYLAAHRGQVVNEEKLMDLFWSQGGKKGLHSLHNGVTKLRQTLSKRDLVMRKLAGYTLGPGCWIDVEEFRSSFAQGRQLARQGAWEEAIPLLRKAEALAGGEFLDGNYADWTTPIRQSLSEPILECRSLLADHFSRRGKHVVAVELWKRVLVHDNCHEEAYRGLMEAYRALGRQADVVRIYQACVKAFETELDLPPPPDLQALLEI